jgi:hypothetical protein
MDTEADTQGPKDDELNPQIGLVGEQEITERNLVNTDSEMTRGNGAEDETILPGDLGELGGERGSVTRACPTQGGEKKRKLGRPDTETSDRDPETDNTKIQLDVVKDGKITEKDNIDSKTARGNRAEDTTIPHEGRSYNGLSGTSGLASNPANREIASSSGASEHQDIFFFDFYSIFFPQKT